MKVFQTSFDGKIWKQIVPPEFNSEKALLFLFFDTTTPTEITIEGKEYLIMRESDIFAVL